MSAPTFHYQPINEDENRFKVFTDAPGDDDGFLYQGIAYETADRNWVADWEGRSSNPIAMPGFATRQYAAEALYYYAPPQQSFGSRPAGKHLGLVDELKIDKSQCGCCVNNNCECEGLNRISERFGITHSYEVQPSLIPAPGVLFSLMPMKDSGDFLIDSNTRGSGVGIGYLQQRDDGRYDVRVGATSIGIAPKPETGMWACLKAHTNTKRYGRLLDGYEPHDQALPDTE